jgi:fatty acid desaturase
MLVHREDLLNAIRGFTAPILFLLPFYASIPSGKVFFATALLWLALGDINHILHLHVHNPFFRDARINTILDLCMGMVTGMTATNWRIQHIYGHHRGHDYGPARAWEIRRFSVAGAMSYSLRTAWPIFYRPLAEAFRKGMGRNPIRYPLDFRWALIEQCGLVVVATLLLVIAPMLTLCYVLPWYLLVYIVSRYTDYLNHFGTMGNGFDAANNCLNRLYNRIRCNFGYHSAHHHRPDAHWTALPAIHETIAASIPRKNLKPYSWSGYLMPYHFYLSRRGRM